MKKKKTAILALAVAATMTCGMLAGCDLVTTDSRKDFVQVIATVDITKSETFADEFKGLEDTIQPSDILKRDMIASFMSNGSNAMNTNGWTYRDTFNAICESLINRQLTIQYATAYLLKSGVGTADGYREAVKGKEGTEKELAGLAYFLDEDELARANYNTKRLFNNTLDSQERTYIKSETEEDSETVTVRTLPTGVNTANSDYYDPAYKIYTGSAVTSEAEKAVASALASDCGNYETVEGSTPYTRRKAFGAFLASLRQNDLLLDGEDTTKFEELSYYKMELKSAYESAIITKLGDLFEKEAEETLNQGNYMQDYYNTILASQKDAFGNSASDFESQLDSLSDTNFLLAAPDDASETAKYGYVINILLPFSSIQAAQVKNLTPDYNDPKGNSFVQRAAILDQILATDQRGTWFTGETDYSFDGTSVEGAFTNGNDKRAYLFFEDSLLKSGGDNDEYEPLKKYYGKYTYNGTVITKDDKPVPVPEKIKIDDFMKEMEEYLKSTSAFEKVEGAKTNTYAREWKEFYKQENGSNVVDYSKFVYYEGKVTFKEAFDANDLFVAGTPENTALSVMNELSFAYNTDTAGLNSYLGYSVVTGKTSFVSEFEYAAQKACEGGAGTYVVAPSDYGWHVIYCTFAFSGDNQDGFVVPFTYDDAQKEVEGSFSNLFYESVKATIVEKHSSTMQTTIVHAYKTCATIYEDRYSDLLNLDA